MLHIKDIFDDVMIYIVWGFLAAIFVGPFVVLTILWHVGSSSEELSPLPANILKTQFRDCFEDNEIIDDDFVYILDYEDVDSGGTNCFAVYYRQQKGTTNTILVVPVDENVENCWTEFLERIRNSVPMERSELERFTFSLQGETLWVSMEEDLREA